MAATLEMQYQALESENARLVLQAAAIQGEATQVPLARLALMTGLDGQPTPGYPDPLEEALAELQGLSLIEELKEGALRLHPLVSKFVVGTWKTGRRLRELRRAAGGCAGDMARLNREVRIAELTQCWTTCEPECSCASAREDIAARLNDLLRPLDLETHNLRKWDPQSEPSFFLQQLHFRALNRESALCWEIESQLEKVKLPWLRERKPTI